MDATYKIITSGAIPWNIIDIFLSNFKPDELSEFVVTPEGELKDSSAT